MFDLRKIFDLRKSFAVPKNFLKLKIYCTTFGSKYFLVFKNTDHQFAMILFTTFLTTKSWIRKPKSLILHKKIEKSYLTLENWRALSYMRNTESSIRNMEDSNVCPMSAQCLPNVCPMSSQCPQYLPNVVRGQISDFFWYVYLNIQL